MEKCISMAVVYPDKLWVSDGSVAGTFPIDFKMDPLLFPSYIVSLGDETISVLLIRIKGRNYLKQRKYSNH
jgi:hypothetical protein